MMNDELFPVVILAGGLATRLRPLTEKIPKSLLEVNGKPFIEHQLNLLKQHGIKRVVICTGYLGEMIKGYVEDGHRFGLSVTYSSEGSQLLGTAGAIKHALPLLDDNFFVLYGDSYLPCQYAAVQEAYKHSNQTALMTVFHNQGQWDKSNVEFNQGKIIVYDKKQQTERMQYIDYGLGVFNKKAFMSLPLGTPYDLADLYQSLLQAGRLAAFEVKERFYEAGSFAGIKELEYYLAHLTQLGEHHGVY